MPNHVFIAIPAYTGQVHIQTMRSLMHDVLAFKDRGDTVEVYDESGSSLIADARAVCVAKFLETDATHLIFIDNDVTWPAGTLLKLVDHGEDFVGGAYPHRRDPLSFPVSWDMGKSELWASDKGLLEVVGLPGGFICLTRAMLEKMVAAYPNLTYFSKDAASGMVCGLFDSYRLGGVKFGEDFSFCRRWRDLGGKVWLDPEINLGHIGFKTFTGHIGDWLRNRESA